MLIQIDQVAQISGMIHSQIDALKSFLFTVFSLLFLSTMNAQSVGDYRSVASGNWTNVSVWQVYNGVTWTAASSYPGQLTGTNDVLIQGGYSVSISSTIPNTVNSLTIGDGTGAVDNFYIANTSSLQTQLITIADGGLVAWTSNVAFTISSGAAFIIETGGTLSNTNPCSSAKRLIIGTTVYSTCNGGAGTDYSFDDLETSGGSISVSPTSNGPICEGTTLNLFSNPSGAGSSSATFSWSGSGPLGYSFSSSVENPSIANLAAGSYTYSVTITDSYGTTNTNSVDVTVNSSAIILSQPVSQTICPNGSTSFDVTAAGTNTYQWQYFDGANWVDQANTAIYSGATTATLILSSVPQSENNKSLRVVVTAGTNSCSTVSDTVTLTVEDTIPPTASNPAPVTVFCTEGIPSPDVSIVTDEADNCSTSPTVSYVGDVSDGGSNPEIITRTYRIADDAGNTTDVYQTIQVNYLQIDTQPQNQTVFVGNNGNFSVSQSNGDEFQWQVSTDGGVNFVDIMDGSLYSGTQTDTLTVIIPQVADTGHLFRVIVSNAAASSCPTVVSNSAILTVGPSSVISNRKITYRVNN